MCTMWLLWLQPHVSRPSQVRLLGEQLQIQPPSSSQSPSRGPKRARNALKRLEIEVMCGILALFGLPDAAPVRKQVVDAAKLLSAMAHLRILMI